MTVATRTLASLAAGEPLAPLHRSMDLVSMVAYAGATWDWHRMHYDREYVAAKGFAAPVVDGQVFGALLVEVLQDGLGPAARVRTLDFRFRSMVHAGEDVRCEATWTGVVDGRAAFDCVVVAIADGEERVAVTGTATVELPA